MDALLKGVEEGSIPTWAKPAVAAVDQILASRGLEASTVGRDALLNVIIQNALPIAQQNAQANQQKQTRLNYVKSKPFVKNNQGETALDAFVGEYGVSALPMNISEFKNVGSGDLKRPRVGSFEMKAWDNTWGKYLTEYMSFSSLSIFLVLTLL